jgi:hypothetical protein
VVLARAPAAPGRAGVGCRRCLGEGGGLPAERGELAGAGDRDDAGGLAALTGEDVPALVQASLGAPGDLDHPGVLGVLAAGEGPADGRLVVVVMGGFGWNSPDFAES